MTSESTTMTIPSEPTVWHTVRAIARQDWLRNRSLVIILTCLLVASVYILPVFDQIGLLIVCLLIGQLLAIRFAGRDIAVGCEMFAFSLTPRRKDYFWTRYLSGLGISLLLLMVAFVGFQTNASSHLWSLWVESGLARVPQFSNNANHWQFGLACLLGSYTCTYSMTVLGHRNWTNLAWAAGCIAWIGLPCLFYVVLGLLVDSHVLLNEMTPKPIGFAGLVSGVFCLTCAHWGYHRKSADSKRTVGLIVGLFMVAVAMVLLMLMFAFAKSAASRADEAQREAKAAEAVLEQSQQRQDN